VLTCEGGHKVKVEGHCKKISGAFQRKAPGECPSTFKIAPAPMLQTSHQLVSDTIE